MANAVILNDTRGDSHFGCFRVMRLIEENLASRGIRVLARSGVRNDWENDRPFLDAMAKSDVIVINGEGTLHHGAKAGARLLRVVDHPARGDKPVALINAIYQENPEEWSRYLEKMTIISTRDSWSAEEAGRHAGRAVGFVPDLSLSDGFEEAAPGVTRDLLLVGDSVSREVSRRLLALADSRADARLLPILRTIKASKPHVATPLRLLREAYIRLHAAAFGWTHGNVLFNRDEAGFIDALQHGYLHVTGRFHAVCFCLFTRTPFLAIESNSWKIRALMHDLGLGDKRLVGIDDLPDLLARPDILAYSEDEMQAIGKGIAMCRTRTAALFDEIARAARRD
ncbi:polysaccharide pyruvyl transferase family protein [Ciceribacter thiooxidans]|uniref:Polysaccharide pyruvyl transferase family protein n=1 Tax=Ciceribacter thiooxidans TaxID=1969821 RepID=A0ABV7I1P4_9HYPH|nr:polysaccharide pyruvyl transferase family protein [Ciceribacter thiooxidans]